MEGNKSKPRALLVFGAPCSGKTTFAEKFSKRFDLSYYDFETIKAEYGLDRNAVLMILGLITRTHKNIIIEGELGSERARQEVRNILLNAGYEPALIWVQTDLATIRNRMKAKYRGVAKAKDAYDALMQGLEAPAEWERPIILSGKHTFETQARHTLAGLADNSEK